MTSEARSEAICEASNRLFALGLSTKETLDALCCIANCHNPLVAVVVRKGWCTRWAVCEPSMTLHDAAKFAGGGKP